MTAAALGLLCRPAAAQEKLPAPVPPPAPSPPTPAPPAPTVVAATVNGQAVPELAVYRSLKRLPPARHAEARPEIVNYLIDNVLIDQYFNLQKIAADPKDVDAKIKQIRAEIEKQKGSTFDKVLKELMLSEDELRTQIAAQLRWDQYVNEQATDKALHELFDNNHEMFDGTLVSARHILLSPASNDPKAIEEAKSKLLGIKKQIEEEVAKGLAKLPTDADNLKREEARTKLTDEAFAAVASKESACPSKADGGNLPYFPRVGSMVESFAKTAFELKPYQMSDLVTTQFGYHLILAKDRKPGKETKFDDVKDEVKEVFGDRLRESLAGRLRADAKIVINPAPKAEGQ
jgi:peptidyl-prolyl cis-trans isomerase C